MSPSRHVAGGLHEAPRVAEILVVRDPFVFAVRRDLDTEERGRLRPILARLAAVGRARILPLLREAYIDRDVYTSAGSRQILIDTSFDECHAIHHWRFPGL